MEQKQQITQYLLESNPWWQNRQAPAEFNWLKREVFGELKTYLNLKQMISLIGLRRVGKTVLLKQAIGWLMKEKKVSPKNICFISFEENSLELSAQTLEQAIYAYLELNFQAGLNDIKQKIYIFIDEIQYIKQWPGVLKRIYDLNSKFKFIVSGSSAIFIKTKTRESLAGRIFDIHIYPLLFKEYLGLKKENYDLPMLNLLKISPQILNELKIKYKLKLAVLDKLYQQYLLSGQFPEMINFTPRQAFEYINNTILNKLLKYDLPLLRDINQPFKLKTILDLLIYETGSIIAFQNIAAETVLAQATAESYINYLAEAFLISVLDNYSKSLRPKKRRLKKVYIASTNFIAAIQPLVNQDILAQPFQGHLIETDVFNKLNSLAQKENLFLSFWRKKSAEADFVLGRAARQLVGEVKYSNKIKNQDLKSLLSAMAKLKTKRGLVFTRHKLDYQKIDNKEIYFIPACLI